MQIRNIHYSPNFEKAFKSLPLKIRKKAIEKERIFRKNIFDKSIKVHKLKGKLKECWAFSINHSYRVLFEFDENNDIGFIDIGTHSIYY